MEDKKPNEEEEAVETSPLDPLHAAVENYTDELGDKAEAVLTRISDRLPGVFRELALEKIAEAREEMGEEKNSFLKEMKETAQNFLNSLFGDFALFWSVVKTLGVWFVRPVSLDTKLIALENKALAMAGEKPKRFTDIALLKSLFILSLAFLVIEETATDAASDEWIMQAIFFMFYVTFLFVFIAAVWGWRKLVGLPKRDTRVFVGYVIYQYAAMYLVSFVICGPLGLDALADDASGLLFIIVYVLPVLHSVYFLWRLMTLYELTRRRKLLGAFIGAIFMAFLLIIPLLTTHTFMVRLEEAI